MEPVLLVIAVIIFPGVYILGFVLPMIPVPQSPKAFFILLFSAVTVALLGLDLEPAAKAIGIGLSVFFLVTAGFGNVKAVPISAIMGLVSGLYTYFSLG